MKQLLSLGLLILAMQVLSACSSPSSLPEASAPPTSASVDPREHAKCADDNRKYNGISCFNMPLGISLGKFREIIGTKSTITEEATKFPNILRKYSIHPFPGAPIQWDASAHFVIDGNCYRLYKIDGFSSNSTSELIQYFSKKFGRPKQEGLACIWGKAGTTLRILDGDQPLISFTHDKLIDLSSEKMADAMDRGDYIH